MKRFPDDRLMKTLFQNNALTEEHLRRIAMVLARFHATAEQNADIDRFGTAKAFKVNTDENFAQTEKYIGISIQADDFHALKAWTADFYQTHGAAAPLLVGAFLCRLKEKANAPRQAAGFVLLSEEPGGAQEG